MKNIMQAEVRADADAKSRNVMFSITYTIGVQVCASLLRPQNFTRVADFLLFLL